MLHRTTALLFIGQFVLLTIVQAAELIEFEKLGGPSTQLIAEDVSADGEDVLIRQLFGASWVWSRSKGLENVPIDEVNVLGLAMSANGRVVAGSAENETFVWDRESNSVRWIPIADRDRWNPLWDLSADGSFGAGVDYSFGGMQAFRWSRTNGREDLVTPEGWTSSRAYGISTDGTTIVGRVENDNTSDGFVWEHGEFKGLDLPGESGSPKSADAVSDDAKFVAASADEQLFRWESSTDTLTPLGNLDGFNYIYGSAISAEGDVILGEASDSINGPPTETRGFVWDQIHGIRNLTDVLRQEHGLTYPLERGFQKPQGVSADKRVIVGWTRQPHPNGDDPDIRAWAVYLDRPLVVTSGVAGDFNDNAELDVEDLDILAKELRTNRNVSLFDVNGDSIVDSLDRNFWVSNLANTFFGDTNLDQQVNFADFLALSNGFGKETGWAQGDFDGDGQTKFEDFLMLSENFGKATEIGDAASVPEPSSRWLLSLGALAVFRSRRVRRRPWPTGR